VTKTKFLANTEEIRNFEHPWHIPVIFSVGNVEPFVEILSEIRSRLLIASLTLWPLTHDAAEQIQLVESVLITTMCDVWLPLQASSVTSAMVIWRWPVDPRSR